MKKDELELILRKLDRKIISGVEAISQIQALYKLCPHCKKEIKEEDSGNE